jgi:CelD/BcsL family acetyltransferase involved in cellulose biosynthesis
LVLPAGSGSAKHAGVTEINDFAELARFRPHWDSLLAETPGASFFQTFDWLEVYWRHFASDQRLRVLIVRGGDGPFPTSAAWQEGDAPLGIVPLVERTERTRFGRARVLTYPLDYWGMFYGPIGPTPADALAAAMVHVGCTRRDWDLIDLRWVDREGCDAGATPAALRLACMPARERLGEHGAVIEIADSWQAYWSSRGHRWRNNVGRCERKLAEQGEVSYQRYRPQGSAHGNDDPRWDLYQACEVIARQSWQGSSTSGTTLSHETVSGFLRDAHAAAARAGGVDLNLLHLSGRPVAFAYCYQLNGHIYGLRTGYDSSACDAGAGTVLLRRLIEDSFARGDRCIDLGPGYLESKRPWLTTSTTSYRYLHYSAGLRAQALRFKDALKDWFGRKV